MNRLPLQLPWTLATVPHAVLDILRGCNIRCRDCYNLQPDRTKPLEEVDAELEALTKLRQLQSLSIVGGEVTLHPDLVEIVRRVRKRGLFVELFSNGLDLTEGLLAALKEAGVNVIFLHIERDQRRPDLPADATEEDLRRLRAEKAGLVAAHGIEVGLAVTAYPEKLDEVEEAVSFALESPSVCYLLVTWWRDVGRMPPIHGDLADGMTSEANPLPRVPPAHEVRPGELCEWLEKHCELTPFASLGSNQDPADPRWLSFMVATVHRQGKLSDYRSLRATWLEQTFLEASRRLTGRYPFYQAQREKQFGVHLLLNGMAGGGLAKNLRLLRSFSRPGGKLSAKRILFQWPATFDCMGRVIHCQCCPDAVLRDGRLVPLCISDRVVPKEPAIRKASAVLTRV